MSIVFQSKNVVESKSFSTVAQLELILFTLGVLIFYLSKKYLLIVEVTGTSMMPIFRDGEKVLVLRHWPPNLIRRNQICVFDLTDPSATKNSPKFIVIKRVTGLPGDETTYKKRSETASIIRSIIDGTSHRVNEPVPEAHYFISSANDAGLDSSDWGFVPFRALIGIALVKLPVSSMPT